MLLHGCNGTQSQPAATLIPAKDDQPGKLLWLKQTDGTPIDLAKTYTVGVSENQMMEVANVYNFFGSPAGETGMLLRQAVAEHIQRLETVKPELSGRIQIQ